MLMSMALVYGMMNQPEPQKSIQNWEPDENSEKILRIITSIWINIGLGTATLASASLVPIISAYPALTFDILKTTMKIAFSKEGDPEKHLIEKGVDKFTAKLVIDIIEKFLK